MLFRRAGKRRMLCFALAVFSLLGMLILPLSAPADAAGRTGTVKADGGVNVRSAPNTSSSVVTALANGTKVTIVDSVSGQTITAGDGRSSRMWYQLIFTSGG